MLTHLSAIWSFRHFWMSLVKLDLRTRYRRSVLGIGWSVLNPVLMSAVLVLGFGQVLGRGDTLGGYGAFLLPGLCVWDFLRNSTIVGCNALVHNEAYIRQCPLPYGIYPLRTVLGTGVHFLITLGVVTVLNCLLFYFGTDRNPFTPLQHFWAVIPVVAMMFVFCWSTATLAAFATAYFPDTQHLMEVTASMLFFLTPIMIMPDNQPAVLRDTADYNPVCVFLDLIRAPLYQGELPDHLRVAEGAVLTAVTFLAACLTIRTLQKKVIFQL